MKFVRGVILGSIITAGAMMVCSEEVDSNKKRMLKRGKQFAKRVRWQTW